MSYPSQPNYGYCPPPQYEGNPGYCPPPPPTIITYHTVGNCPSCHQGFLTSQDIYDTSTPCSSPLIHSTPKTQTTTSSTTTIFFPNSNHIGCYFHFTQSVYRHIQQFGLSSAYINDENIRMICRKLMALALLPSSVVLKSFEDLYESVLLASSSELGSLRPLFDYFENYWIKRIDINKWNVYGIRIRTNNNAEGMQH
ncbi:unnamed protein product [Rotaria sordida]|uniref:Uncharacterized protein n=1 Tax=Rotaria sordida TaxID=392033 RepID=A0A814A9E4_9BILA|nr:unnamed protein product [Rotaria sordida]